MKLLPKWLRRPLCSRSSKGSCFCCLLFSTKLVSPAGVALLPLACMPPRPRGQRSVDGLANRKRATRERKKKRAKAKSGPVAPPGVWRSPSSSDLSSEGEHLEEKSSLSPLKKARRVDDASQTAPTSSLSTSSQARFVPRAARAPHFLTSPETCVCGGSGAECPYRSSPGVLAPRPKSRVVSLSTPVPRPSDTPVSASASSSGSASTPSGSTVLRPGPLTSSATEKVQEAGTPSIPPRREDRFSIYRARIKARREESLRWEAFAAGAGESPGH